MNHYERNVFAKSYIAAFLRFLFMAASHANGLRSLIKLSLIGLLFQVDIARAWSFHCRMHHEARRVQLPSSHSTLLRGTSQNTDSLTEQDFSYVATGDSADNALDWVNYGMSWIYLTHFASLYVQLPGLFGATGLLPIQDRIVHIVENLWTPCSNQFVVRHPELLLEVSCALGMVITLTQITFPKVRYQAAGVLSYGLLWFLWHDMVVCGDRFTLYQMDKLVLDVAPITLLAASGISSMTPAATFGFRWLLSRLYIGAGAVKLLSCDLSWRNLSAIHWHFQSQPLPNVFGATAYKTLPDIVTHPLTLMVLILELAAPFLCLTPDVRIRKVAFVVNALLMAGIATFGDFGVLQVMLGIISLSLLDELPPAPGEHSNKKPLNVSKDPELERLVGEEKVELSVRKPERSDLSSGSLSPSIQNGIDAFSVTALVLATAGAAWTVADLGACRDTLSAVPLGISLVALGSVAALQPLWETRNTVLLGLAPLITSMSSLALLAGSTVPLLNSLDMYLPYDWSEALQLFNFGAEPYGLFAIMTGVAGRPVAAVEGAYSVDGPWTHIPLLYQINDPSSALPLCFPHFPRFDWTLWFVPLGETGSWIQQLLRGIVVGDPAIVDSILDSRAFHCDFPGGPPDFVRVVPRIYELHPESTGWLVSEDPASPMARGVYSRDYLLHDSIVVHEPWPSIPGLRALAELGRPEYFVWACLGSAETSRRVVSTIYAPSRRGR